MTEDRRTAAASPQPEYAGLLTQVMTTTLDEDYATVADRRARAEGTVPDGTAGRRVALVAVLVAFGVMVGVSALKTNEDRPQSEAERAEIVAQIHKRQSVQEDLAGQINDVKDDVARLQGAVGSESVASSTIADRLATLGADAGTLAVEGPGMVITVDDAPSSSRGSGGTILDTDLQTLANALWIAGAEAISIDGHRLTSLTAIRFAGEAITVDNVSLNPPYVLSAVGDPDTLPARLLETDGGQSWLGLQANFGIQFDRRTKDNVSVPADPHEHLAYAEPAGGG